MSPVCTASISSPFAMGAIHSSIRHASSDGSAKAASSRSLPDDTPRAASVPRRGGQGAALVESGPGGGEGAGGGAAPAAGRGETERKGVSGAGRLFEPAPRGKPLAPPAVSEQRHATDRAAWSEGQQRRG